MSRFQWLPSASINVLGLSEQANDAPISAHHFPSKSCNVHDKIEVK